MEAVANKMSKEEEEGDSIIDRVVEVVDMLIMADAVATMVEAEEAIGALLVEAKMALLFLVTIDQ